MFLKILFFFLIANISLGIVIGQLNTDPVGNPNTTLFSDRNITVANVTSSVNVTEFASDQHTPTNETGGIIEDASAWLDSLDFLNVQEMLNFLAVFDYVFATNQMDQMLELVGVEFPPGVVDGISVLISFAGIIWFMFLIFKVGPSSFT